MARSAKWEVRSVRKMIATVVLVCFFVIYAFWQVANSRSFQFFGEIIPRVKTTEKVVALTFDDGPTAKTPEILTILREIGVKATFFVTGNLFPFQNGAEISVLCVGRAGKDR